MAKAIEVLNSAGNSYHVSVDQAWELVNAGNARWLDHKRIERTPDTSLKVTWHRKQSGYAGPIVLQVKT